MTRREVVENDLQTSRKFLDDARFQIEVHREEVRIHLAVINHLKRVLYGIEKTDQAQRLRIESEVRDGSGSDQEGVARPLVTEG